MNITAEEHYGTVQLSFIVNGRYVAFAIVGGQNLFDKTTRSLYFCRQNWVRGHFDAEASEQLERFLKAWSTA